MSIDGESTHYCPLFFVSGMAIATGLGWSTFSFETGGYVSPAGHAVLSERQILFGQDLTREVAVNDRQRHILQAGQRCLPGDVCATRTKSASTCRFRLLERLSDVVPPSLIVPPQCEACEI